MKTRAIVLIAILLAVAAAAVWVGWMIRYRPLTVFAWQTRAALRTAGLRKVTVEAPVGRQTVFTGGTGPLVVLLHGAGDGAGTWFKVVPELIRAHRLVVPDLAGHGESAPRRGPIDLKDVIGGFEAAMDAVTPGEKAVLVGNSLGAWVAMVEAQRRPGRVAAVVCIDGGAIRGNNLSARVLPRTRDEARESVAQTRDPGSAPVPDFVLDDIVRQARTGPLARLAATASTMDRWILDEERLRDLSVPVHLIWGRSDRLVPLEYAERMRANLPEPDLVVLDRCGHVPQIECPDALLAALREAVDSSQSTVDSPPVPSRSP
ncbi:MAG TPA: alpha/beta fold hydrolase [Thermoanaerobaculaceae bacterium]|nr:alpha/beta fold hydrolase [Thermoanaerobaculaceae bacterium]